MDLHAGGLDRKSGKLLTPTPGGKEGLGRDTGTFSWWGKGDDEKKH